MSVCDIVSVPKLMIDFHKNLVHGTFTELSDIFNFQVY
jgi:hypothetical protein